MDARFIVLSGVSRGIGRALVHEFASRGHRVAGCARNADAIHHDMLDLHYGERAKEFPDPDAWARKAVPFLLGLGPEHNGQSIRLEP